MQAFRGSCHVDRHSETCRHGSRKVGVATVTCIVLPTGQPVHMPSQPCMSQPLMLLTEKDLVLLVQEVLEELQALLAATGQLTPLGVQRSAGSSVPDPAVHADVAQGTRDNCSEQGRDEQRVQQQQEQLWEQHQAHLGKQTSPRKELGCGEQQRQQEQRRQQQQQLDKGQEGQHEEQQQRPQEEPARPPFSIRRYPELPYAVSVRGSGPHQLQVDDIMGEQRYNGELWLLMLADKGSD